MYLSHEDDCRKLEREAAHLTNNQLLFPELVWEIVLGKILNPIDIESCSNASPYFWNILEIKRELKVVHPRVLQLLSCFFDEYKTDSTNDEDHRGTDMKHFYKLREICKDWNTAIEHLHQSSETGHFRMRADMIPFQNDHLLPLATATFHPDILPQRFVHHFDTTHFDQVIQKPKKNPFLGRKVSFHGIIVENEMEDEDQFYFDGILEILTKYGEEIWYAYFDFREFDEMNLVEIYVAFVTFVKLMPNLKVLKVATKREVFDENEDLELDAPKWMQYFFLAMEVSRNPIPTLQQLQYLWTTDLSTKIFDELLQKNKHISKLQVDRKEHHSDYCIFNVCLPNLTALGITFCCPDDFKEFETSEIKFRLQKFYFWYNGPSNILTWSRLFSAFAKHLGGYCTELLIQMPLHKTDIESIKTFDDTHCGRLVLPNLQQIAIMCDSSISLDFLLPAKNSLRAIFMRYLNGDEDGLLLKRFAEYEDKQSIKFIGFKERLEDSNIWEEFPILIDLTLFRKMDMGGSVSYIRKWNIKGDSILEKDRWYREKV